MGIEKLNFSVRTYNILKRAQIDTIEQLRSLSDDELLRVRNLGRHSFEEIKEKLKRLTMTNADHIRSMSDEELADFLTDYKAEISRGLGVHYSDTSLYKEAALNFLKQPYKEKEE